ncbi:hypothetical protein [Kitasatospora sp. NPDC018619]|uniref:hypothetical protein n=1 Tax=unclassified Kitasatospora TaxID=2633591 RepID=UPI0037B98FFE
MTLAEITPEEQAEPAKALLAALQPVAAAVRARATGGAGGGHPSREEAAAHAGAFLAAHAQG